MAIESRTSSRLLAYLQLVRLPNVFTAMADVAMGFLFTHPSLEPAGEFALLLAASSCLYTAGMVLNDLFDFEQDRRERPQRPLPAGRISRTSTVRLGWGLLLIGVAAGWGAAVLVGVWRPGIIATALAGLILLYNGVVKQMQFAPVAMGGCRMLNVLLGMSASIAPDNGVQWVVAGGIGLYIAGVTRFARSEAAVSKRFELTSGWIAMLAGIIALWWFPTLMPDNQLTGLLQLQPLNWTLLWILLAVVISWRCLWAIRRPEPGRVQAAVKSSILMLVVLDAVVVFAVRGPMASIGILLLLVPAIVLGRWVYST